MFRGLLSREDWNYEREVYRTLRADSAPIVEAIDAVSWMSLEAVDGPASDAPILLKGLLSTEPQIVELSGQLVWDYLCHQGDVYPASPFALPILLKIAGHSTDPTAAECLRLLAQFADGQSMQAEQTDEAVRKPRPTGVEVSIRRWFLENLSGICDLLESPDLAVRCATTDILGRFPECAPVTLSRLELAHERELVPEQREALRQAIEVLRCGNDLSTRA